MNRNLSFYVLTIAVFGSLLWFIFNQGAKLEIEQFTPTRVREVNEGTRAPEHKLEDASQGDILIDFLN